MSTTYGDDNDGNESHHGELRNVRSGRRGRVSANVSVERDKDQLTSSSAQKAQ